ncbi:hypothetical protein ACFCW7_09165 [Paenibacillus glucanolyticus]|uniref:hypothetical protein n=1 Tax=Paenibacillus glucanolyticus TaxID=59843 RepID=UPI0035E0ADCE
MGAVVQMEIWPSVTEEDMKAAKELLNKYPMICRRIEVFSDKEHLSQEQSVTLQMDKRTKSEIEAGFKLILDDEVKRILEHRYIKGKKHKYTIARFHNSTSPSTINRRIEAGVKTIAECLKLAGVI